MIEGRSFNFTKMTFIYLALMGLTPCFAPSEQEETNEEIELREKEQTNVLKS